jgi:hypothetical protein
MTNIFSMKVLSVFELQLPLYETEEIYISLSSLPTFAKSDRFWFKFMPTSLSDLGIFQVKGRLQNYWGTLDFVFSI